jgi:aspartyl-tRNA(Asn)/glutamyl-tRNA(Gln) amidotransferase subunit C
MASTKIALDKDQVQHVAKLARMTLRDDEVPVVTEQLAKILDHIAQLQELDVSNVEPTAQVGVDRLPLRPDAPKPGVPHDLALSQAPESTGGGFVVPAFVDE